MMTTGRALRVASAHKRNVETRRGSDGEMSDVLYELGAETWVRFGSNGIGFLNHKNNYNPKVNCVDLRPCWLQR